MSIRAPRIEFAVGAFLLLALASLLVLALASTNGRWGLGGDTYELTARFSTIGALRPNAPIKIGGVAIGHVARIDVDPVKFDTVVTLAVNKRYDKLPADTAASILTSGLLGESYVNLAPGGDPESLKPGDELYLTQSGGRPDPAGRQVHVQRRWRQACGQCRPDVRRQRRRSRLPPG